MGMNIVLGVHSLRDHLMESTSIYLSGLKISSGEYMVINIVLAAYSWRDHLMVSTCIFLSSLKNTTLYMAMTKWSHWKLRVDMLPTLSSLVALQVVIMTTCSATSDDKVSIMNSLSYQSHWLDFEHISYITQQCGVFVYVTKCNTLRHNENEGVSNHQLLDCLPSVQAQIKENIKALHDWPL